VSDEKKDRREITTQDYVVPLKMNEEEVQRLLRALRARAGGVREVSGEKKGRSGHQTLRRVKLGTHHHASRTRHKIGLGEGARDFPPFVSLEIATGGGDEGFFLFHICGNGDTADTYHQTAEGAMDQAEWEFGVKPEEWMIVAEDAQPSGSE
jgi:hypothetical protein